MGCLYMFPKCPEITLGMFQHHCFCFERDHCGAQAAAGRMSWNALDADVVLREQVCGMKSIDGASVRILNAKLSDCEEIESRSQRYKTTIGSHGMFHRRCCQDHAVFRNSKFD